MALKRANKHILCGVDIGSTKVCVAIGRVRQDADDVEVIGLGSYSLGASDEFDIDRYAQAVESAILLAQDIAKEKVWKVYVDISSGNIKSIVQKSSITISDRATEVRRQDMERLIGNAKEVSISFDREVLHAIPLGWTLDGQDGIIHNPVGLYGAILGLELHIISAMRGYVYNIRKCLRLAGIEIGEMVCGSIATGIAVLSQQERQDGAILIDIGGRRTDACLFTRGLAAGFEQFNFGGEWLTQAISKEMKMPRKHAEMQKLNYVASKDTPLRKAIIREQTKMLKFIHTRIIENGWDKRVSVGIVMTGKSVFLDGLLESAETVFKTPVRMGVVPARYFSNLPYSSDFPISYATAVGLLKYASMRSSVPDTHIFKTSINRRSLLRRFIFRAKEVWREYF